MLEEFSPNTVMMMRQLDDSDESRALLAEMMDARKRLLSHELQISQCMCCWSMCACVLACACI